MDHGLLALGAYAFFFGPVMVLIVVRELGR
jgi:hypothetical protein